MDNLEEETTTPEELLDGEEMEFPELLLGMMAVACKELDGANEELELCKEGPRVMPDEVGLVF